MQLNVRVFLGEGVAASLRKDLFASIMRQDIQFFDNHKSGEIISRLSSDVQEFKSSFKTVVSQGLRSLTQVFIFKINLIRLKCFSLFRLLDQQWHYIRFLHK